MDVSEMSDLALIAGLIESSRLHVWPDPIERKTSATCLECTQGWLGHIDDEIQIEHTETCRLGELLKRARERTG